MADEKAGITDEVVVEVNDAPVVKYADPAVWAERWKFVAVPADDTDE